jgi:hypothetical protein
MVAGRTASGLYVLLVAFAAASVEPAVAQGGPPGQQQPQPQAEPLGVIDQLIDEGLSGLRESPRLLDEFAPGARPLTGRNAKPYRLVVLPMAVQGEDLSAYGGTVAFVNRGQLTDLPFQARFGYRKLKLGNDEQERMILDGRVPIRSLSSAQTTVSLNGHYARTTDVSNRISVGFAGELEVRRRLVLGASARYSRVTPEGGDMIDGFVGAVGAAWRVAPLTSFNLDYQFETDLTGEDMFSFTVVQVLPAVQGRSTNMVLGAARHRTLYASLMMLF